MRQGMSLHQGIVSGRTLVTIDLKAYLNEAFQKMRTQGIHHLIVLEGTGAVGVVSDRDIFEHGMLESGLQLNPIFRVSDVMKRCEAISVGAPLEEVLQAMEKWDTSALPVTLEDGTLSIVTESDMLAYLTRSLAAGDAHGTLEGVAKITLANPLSQKLMRLLSDLGI